MIRKIFIIIIFLAVVLTIFFLNINENALNSINSSFVEIQEISVKGNTVHCSGRIIDNSFYGDYSKYKHRIKGKELFINIYCDEVYTGKNEFTFDVEDEDIGNIEKIFICKGKEKKLIWERRQGDDSPVLHRAHNL